MKKFLLFVAVAMAAMTASAQKTALAKSEQVGKAVVLSSDFNTQSVLSVSARTNKTVKRAQSGDFSLVQAQEWDEYTACETLDFAPTGNKVSKDGVNYDEYEVTLGSCPWQALIDEAKTKIVIPAGQTYNHETYGEFVMLNVFPGDQEGYISLDEETDIVYVLDTESNKFEPEGESLGWWIYMNEGDYQGSCWSNGVYGSLMFPNGVEYGQYSLGSWKSYEYPVFIEDNVDEINIYNFYGYCKLNLLVDEGEVYIPMHQIVNPTSSDAKDEGAGDFFYLIGISPAEEEGYITYDLEKEYTMALFAEVDESGEKLVPSQSSIFVNDYMGIFTNPVKYYMGFLHSQNWMFTNGAKFKYLDPSAIQDVNVKNNKKSTIFNMLGQQVSKNTKGLVIVNGKKVIK